MLDNAFGKEYTIIARKDTLASNPHKGNLPQVERRRIKKCQFIVENVI